MYEDLTRYIDVFSQMKLVLRPAEIAKDDGVGAAGMWYSTDPVYAPELEHYVAGLYRHKEIVVIDYFAVFKKYGADYQTLIEPKSVSKAKKPELS